MELETPKNFPRYRALHAALSVAIRYGAPPDVLDEIWRRWHRSMGAFWVAKFPLLDFETPDLFALLDRSVAS